MITRDTRDTRFTPRFTFPIRVNTSGREVWAQRLRGKFGCSVRAIRRRFSTRLEDALQRLEQRVATGRLKDRSKIERALGRLQARYPLVADLYEMAVREERGALRLAWGLIEERRAWRDAREGAYLLRTNLEGQTAEELWARYIQLTRAFAVSVTNLG